MIKIEDGEYQEYLKLKRWAKKEKILRSSVKSDRLEDDIDLPIKRLVAMFALLGCGPQWSCCGFDYKGQPFHKSHQYGSPYIVLEDNVLSEKIINDISCDVLGKKWRIYRRETDGLKQIALDGKPIQHWWTLDISCIHYPEESIVNINRLGNFLLGYKDEMLESIQLKDMNCYYKEKFVDWQYPCKKPWNIDKVDIV